MGLSPPLDATIYLTAADLQEELLLEVDEVGGVEAEVAGVVQRGLRQVQGRGDAGTQQKVVQRLARHLLEKRERGGGEGGQQEARQHDLI